MRCLTLGCCLLISVASALAQQARQGAVLTVIEENDLVVNTDRHYTQGIKISYLHGDDYFPYGSERLYGFLPKLGFTPEVGKFGYSVGQSIYTPADLKTSTLLPYDRPYAGWLYGAAILQRRGMSFGRFPAQEEYEFEYGFVGPSALAQESQTWVHHVRGFPIPQGWDNQLRNEPGLRLKYWRGMKLLSLKGDMLDLDWIPHVGISLGNVDTSVRLGARLRIGVNIPDDYGIQTIDSLATTSGGVTCSRRHRWGAYFFGAVEGRGVLHNVFLDGNLFEQSHSVDKEVLVGDVAFGFVVVLNRIEVGYAQFYRTPEFRFQTEHDSFGAVFAKIKF